MWNRIAAGCLELEVAEDLCASRLCEWVYDEGTDLPQIDMGQYHISPKCLAEWDMDPSRGIMTRVRGVVADLGNTRVFFLVWMGTQFTEHWLLNITVDFCQKSFQAHNISVHNAYNSQVDKQIQDNGEDFWN